jgi:ATP-dependent DNA helicase RecG
MNDWSVITGRVCKVDISRGNRARLTCVVEDKTGLITLRFFHFNKQQAALLRQMPLIHAFGEVRMFSNALEMVHPEYRLLNDDDICPVEETLTPIYASTQGLSQTRLRQLIKQALTHCQLVLNELEWMSATQLEQLTLPSIREALTELHSPPPDVALHALENGQHRGLQRLALDELLAKRLSLHFIRQTRARLQAHAHPSSSPILSAFIQQLPYVLTTAQQRVHQEIAHDMTQATPMLRLVQGDVGAGKTVIAALSAMQAIANGYQVAFMAPTDLLSEQHALTLSAWFAPFNIQVARLSGKMKAKARKETLLALKTNACQLIVGTHALFQEQVEFHQLGLIIIDEQHRFGVEQRLLLQQKGCDDTHTPHQLMMTATPIPRTLAMTQFAHLDLSVIDELPPGRTPIVTTVMSQHKRHDIIERLNASIINGRQAYWVCTLIDESEKMQCMAAIASAETLQTQLPNVRVGLVHGRMSAEEKEKTMQAFKAGDLDLLVATTVIEVGVDVPNASLMIIENAERLGLSQLHQLRGRVGRGTVQSHCLLLYQAPLSKQATARLRLLRETTDGFLIAEKDLELRGEGLILGTQQTGYRPFKIASLPRDGALLTALSPLMHDLLHKKPQTAHHLAKRWYGDFEFFISV